MKEVIVNIGQNLCDIAIQETGSLDSLFEIAIANNLDPHDDIVPGQTLVIPQEAKPQVVKYLKDKNIKVTSE